MNDNLSEKKWLTLMTRLNFFVFSLHLHHIHDVSPADMAVEHLQNTHRNERSDACILGKEQRFLAETMQKWPDRRGVCWVFLQN